MNLLTLRAVEVEDKDKIFYWENDCDNWLVGANYRWLSKYSVEEYIADSQTKDVLSCSQMRLMLKLNLKQKNQAIGCIDLYDIDARNSRAGVGFFVEKEYRNQGFATLALKKMELYCKNILNLHQIHAQVPSNNVVCNKIFQSLEYNLTGTLQDWLKQYNNYTDVNCYQKIF